MQVACPHAADNEKSLLYNTKLKHDRTLNMAKNTTTTAAATTTVVYAKLHWAMSKLS